MILNQSLNEQLNELQNMTDQQFKQSLEHGITEVLSSSCLDKENQNNWYYFLVCQDQNQYQLTQFLKKQQLQQSKIKIGLETLKPLKLEIEILQSSINNINGRQLVNINWRFDLQTSSRHFRNQFEPKIVIKVQDQKEDLVLSSDLANLINFVQVIDDALLISELTDKK